MIDEETAIKEAVERGFLSNSRMSERFVDDWEFVTQDIKQQIWFKSRESKVWILIPPGENIHTNIIPFYPRKSKR
jgi:hypothetical protein